MTENDHILCMGTNSYLSSVLEASSWTLWRIMKKSHNRSRFCRLKNPMIVNSVKSINGIKPFLEEYILPYRRRNFLEAQVLEQITEITADQFQAPYDYR